MALTHPNPAVAHREAPRRSQTAETLISGENPGEQPTDSCGLEREKEDSEQVLILKRN